VHGTQDSPGADAATLRVSPSREAPPAPDAGGGRPRLWPAVGAAVLGGLALAAAFPPVGLWPLAPFGPALLVLALRGRRARGAFGLGLLFGLALFVPLLTWIGNLAWYIWLGLSVAEALIFGLLAIGQRLLLRLPCWPWAVAGWWVLAEAVRARVPAGQFPWGRLAMSQADAPTLRWAAIGGAPLVTFVVALVGASLAYLVLVPRARRPLAALVTLGALALACSASLLPRWATGGAANAGTARIAAVQGNVPHARNLDNFLRANTVTRNHAVETLRLAARVRSGATPAPDLVIWPENATDLDPGLYPEVRADIAAPAATLDRPILAGVVLQHPLRNGSQLWVPGKGPVQTYLKQHLVPFGESNPLRPLLAPFFPIVNLAPHDYQRGTRPGVFPVGRIRLGDALCYDAIFDDTLRNTVTRGANLLTVQSNDATYQLDGQLGETLQQLAVARERAVELDRAVVVVSTTGVSAIVAPDGRVTQRSGAWVPATLEADLPLRTSLTLAARVGPWPERVLSVGAALAVLVSLVGVWRGRSAPGRSFDAGQATPDDAI
jgi:apolipoprotein N-acyltransferase